MKSAIAIRHVAFEDMGSFSSVLSDHDLELQYLDAGVCDLASIDPCAADLMIILGGPIGAYEEESYPFILDELRLLEKRLSSDLPTLGICLGAQIMARALGAKVYPGPVKEIGWKPLSLTESGRNSPLQYLDGEITNMLHWHGDTFDLPKGATLLASTDVCRQQAYSWGQNTLAFQCHPEAQVAKMESWFIGHANEIAAAKLPLTQLRADTSNFGSTLETQGAKCFSLWLDGIGL